MSVMGRYCGKDFEGGFRATLISRSRANSKLLKPGPSNSRSENEITIANGKRDTLYVIRELARSDLKMNLAESYERRP